MKVNVLATGCCNQVSSGPHADAPTVAIVRTDLVIPLPCRLFSDLPKIAFGPPFHGLAFGVQQLRANAMGLIVVAPVVVVAEEEERNYRERPLP